MQRVYTREYPSTHQQIHCHPPTHSPTLPPSAEYHSPAMLVLVTIPKTHLPLLSINYGSALVQRSPLLPPPPKNPSTSHSGLQDRFSWHFTFVVVGLFRPIAVLLNTQRKLALLSHIMFTITFLHVPNYNHSQIMMICGSDN